MILAPLLVVPLAALLCAGLILLLKPLLQRYALARPNARSSHRVPTPQGGGIAIPAPAPAAFGIPDDHPGAEWVRRRLTPHPLGTYESPLRLRNPVGNGRPRTYIVCTSPIYAPLEASRQWVRGQQGWGWREIATGHDAMVTAPDELARMLAAIG